MVTVRRYYVYRCDMKLLLFILNIFLMLFYNFQQFWMATLLPLIILKEKNNLVATKGKEPAKAEDENEHVATIQRNEHQKTEEEKRKEKIKTDSWYPTAKNIFKRGFNDDRWGCMTPLVFFFSTPRVKFYYHTVSGNYFLISNRSQPSNVHRYW